MGNNKQMNILDIMSVVSFMIGLANYEENLGQSSVQDVIKGALHEVHKHLEEQDEKINKILKLLEGGSLNVNKTGNGKNDMH